MLRHTFASFNKSKCCDDDDVLTWMEPKNAHPHPSVRKSIRIPAFNKIQPWERLACSFVACSYSAMNGMLPTTFEFDFWMVLFKPSQPGQRAFLFRLNKTLEMDSNGIMSHLNPILEYATYSFWPNYFDPKNFDPNFRTYIRYLRWYIRTYVLIYKHK